MSDTFTIKAPAKINLFLKVLNKRPDGYHNIHSWFQAVGLFDQLTFSRTGEGIRLTIEGPTDLPDDSRNLVVKTAEMLLDRFKIDGGLDIRLTKNIPIAAGLGGGSSDAAATIYAVNKIFGLNLDKRLMAALGSEIGSDIPFFFSGGQADVTGRGEVIREISLPIDYEILLITPPISISTKESYQSLNLDLTSRNNDVKLLKSKDFEEMVAALCSLNNDFEKGHVAAYPVLSRIRDMIERSGAALTRMSGSGPSMFGLFKRVPEGVRNLPKILPGEWHRFVLKPIYLPVKDN
jgi:4-diphosphocytidyl-2-C-methyl-D-erythritol kinase